LHKRHLRNAPVVALNFVFDDNSLFSFVTRPEEVPAAALFRSTFTVASLESFFVHLSQTIVSLYQIKIQSITNQQQSPNI